MQHVFLSLTKVKPSPERMWPLSQRFSSKSKQQERGTREAFSSVVRCLRRTTADLAAPRIPDGRHPPAGIPLYAPHGNHLHICRSNVCAFREGRANSIIELWYAVSGQGDGWTNNRWCSREKK